MTFEFRRHSQQLSLTDMLQFPQKWEQYKKQFNKQYHNADEEGTRKQIYFSRYTFMEENNKRYKENLSHFKILHTEFSDLTEGEIEAYYKNNGNDEASGSVVDESAEEKWEQFKTRTKKKYNSESEEDIPKVYFLSKLREIDQCVQDLKKIGLTIDLNEIDHYCEFDNRHVQTLGLDIHNAEHRKKAASKQI